MVAEPVEMRGDRVTFGRVPDVDVSAARDDHDEGALVRVRIQRREPDEESVLFLFFFGDLLRTVERVAPVAAFRRFKKTVEAV